MEKVSRQPKEAKHEPERYLREEHPRQRGEQVQMSWGGSMLGPSKDQQGARCGWSRRNKEEAGTQKMGPNGEAQSETGRLWHGVNRGEMHLTNGIERSLWLLWGKRLSKWSGAETRSPVLRQLQ